MFIYETTFNNYIIYVHVRLRSITTNYTKTCKVLTKNGVNSCIVLTKN